VILAACGGASGQSAIDALPVVTLDCRTYCREIETNCTASTPVPHDGAVHGHVPKVSRLPARSTDTQRNTLGCRIYHARGTRAADADHSLHHAGPAGLNPTRRQWLATPARTSARSTWRLARPPSRSTQTWPPALTAATEPGQEPVSPRTKTPYRHRRHEDADGPASGGLARMPLVSYDQRDPRRRRGHRRNCPIPQPFRPRAAPAQASKRRNPDQHYRVNSFDPGHRPWRLRPFMLH